jgi:iron complex outermembrane receptor protein
MTTSSGKTKFRKTVLSCAVTAALAPFSMASAQEDVSIIDEIIVTSTKRAVNLQDVPIAITAIDGAVLSELGIYSSVDLPKVAVGLKVYWRGAIPDFQMRGGGVAGLNGAAVPLFTNGLSSASSTEAGGADWAGWLDLERVEVMRGPQGTLYGKNTLGGLVNIIHKRPSTEAVDYGFAATVGDYNATKFEGFVNVPLGDQFAFRLTGSKTDQDPLIENKDNPEAGGLRDEDNSYVRAQVLWAPTDAFDVNVIYARWENDSLGNASFGHHYVGMSMNCETGRATGFGTCFDSRKAPLMDDMGNSLPETGGRTYHDLAPDTNPTGYREIDGTFTPTWVAETESLDIELNWDIGFADLTVRARSTEGDYFVLWDVDAGPRGDADGETYITQNDQIDLFLNSKSDQAFRWGVGYYWSDSWDPDENNGSYLWAYVDDQVDENTQYPAWTYWDTNITKSQALYANAEYDITDALTISAGVRSQEDSVMQERLYSNYYGDRSVWGDGYSTTNPVDASYYTEDRGVSDEVLDDSHTDYRVALSYAVNDDVTIYGSVATGYIPAIVDVGSIVKANELETYELGIKSHLADNTVRFNAAIYTSEYTNLSFTVFETCGPSICSRQETGGSLTSEGVEFEFVWAPVDGLNLIAGLMFDNTTLDEFQVNESVFTEARWVEDAASPDGGYWPYRPEGRRGPWLRSDNDVEVPTPSYDVSGNEAAYSPEWIFNLDASYRVELAGGGALIPGITLYSQADYRTLNEPYLFAQQQGYTNIDVRLTWVTSLEKLTVKAFMTNATNELYKVSQNAFSGGRIMADYGRQRMWGVRVGYGF